MRPPLHVCIPRRRRLGRTLTPSLYCNRRQCDPRRSDRPILPSRGLQESPAQRRRQRLQLHLQPEPELGWELEPVWEPEPEPEPEPAQSQS